MRAHGWSAAHSPVNCRHERRTLRAAGWPARPPTDVEADRWRRIPRVLSYRGWVGAPSGPPRDVAAVCMRADRRRYRTSRPTRSVESFRLSHAFCPPLSRCLSVSCHPWARRVCLCISVCVYMLLAGAAPCPDTAAATRQVLRSDEAIKSWRFVDQRATTYDERIHKPVQPHGYRYGLILHRTGYSVLFKT